MKKKVCILHKVSILDPRSFYKEGISLVMAGYDTTIISFYDKEGLLQDIKLISIKYPRNRWVRFILTNVIFLIKSIKEKADVYHFHDVDFIPWAILLKIITFKKVIYDVHEAHPEHVLIKPYIPDVLKKTVSKIVFFMERGGDYFFDAIITNDNYVLQDFKTKQKEVIYNFPILDFFDFAKNNVPYQQREYDIIFIGSLPPWHFTPMLDTVEILAEKNYLVKWLLLPFIGFASKEWMLDQISERGLSNYFTIADTVPFKSVPKYLYNSRIGIITIPPFKKYLKNIPLKIFEYMGCGLPVIASDLPPTRQFVDGRDCAILVKHEPSAYANAIISLLENPDQAQEMGERGKRLVYEKYNWSIEEQKLLRLYGRLVDNGKKHA